MLIFLLISVQRIKQEWFDLVPEMRRCAITPMEKDHLEKLIKKIGEFANMEQRVPEPEVS